MGGASLVPVLHHGPCCDWGRQGRSPARLMKSEPRGHCPPLQLGLQRTLRSPTRRENTRGGVNNNNNNNNSREGVKGGVMSGKRKEQDPQRVRRVTGGVNVFEARQKKKNQMIK